MLGAGKEIFRVPSKPGCSVIMSNAFPSASVFQNGQFCDKQTPSDQLHTNVSMQGPKLTSKDLDSIKKSTFNAYTTLWNLLSEIRYLTLTNYAPMTFGDAKGTVTIMHFKKTLLFTIMGECTKVNEACNTISVVGCFNTFHLNLKSPQAKSDESNLISCSQKTLKREVKAHLSTAGNMVCFQKQLISFYRTRNS